MLSLVPMRTVTTASFYCFSMGYLLGYWANLNVVKRTSNSTINMCFYLVIAFIFYLFTVYIIKSCTWTSGLLSICTGTIFGMVWSQMIADKIDDVEQISVNSPNAKSDGGTMCDGSDNDNMVCNAFRL